MLYAPGSLGASAQLNGVAASRGLGVTSPLTLKCVGPKTIRKASDENSSKSGRFSKRTAPTHGSDPLGERAEPGPSRPSAPFICEYPGCDRSFTTANGRGLHHKRGHPDWNDDRQSCAHVKAPWTTEEMNLVARKEAELTIDGARFINQALLPFFPRRTLDSIKGLRKKADYKNKVSEIIAAIQQEQVSVAQPSPPCGSDEAVLVDYEDALRSYFNNLAPFDAPDPFRAQELHEICSKVGIADKSSILLDLSHYLRAIFPPRVPRGNSHPAAQKYGPPDTRKLSRKKGRRAAFAKAQDLWRKSPRRCLDHIFLGTDEISPPPQEVSEPFWRTIMTRPSVSSPKKGPCDPVLAGLWWPITSSEARKSLPSGGTSAGPDGLSAKTLARTPPEVLVRILNLIMWCQDVPAHLRESRTILIPKKLDAKAPEEFRPITISSVLLRCLHKALAGRLSAGISLDQRQRAFRATDGCADNVFLLDLVLRHHHARHKPLFLASIDVAKAFDTVSHPTILQTLEMRGCPAPLIEYVSKIYERSDTRIMTRQWTSDLIHPAGGVKQGDPLSPQLFNMVLDRLLSALPSDIGVSVGDVRLNAAAFADDLVLMASTEEGLQLLIDAAAGFLKGCGMLINAGKSFTVSLLSVPHEKKTVVRQVKFTCYGHELLSMKRTDDWTYLGIPFTPEGRLKIDPAARLAADLQRLTSAPLKPQQRLFALRVFIIPSNLYVLSLGNVMTSSLSKCDRIVRAAVRRWLDLPGDTPTAYYHASVADGGLGIPSLRWTGPQLRLSRLSRLYLADDARNSAPGDFLKMEINRAKHRLSDSGSPVVTGQQVRDRWARLLYERVDGMALRESRKTPRQHEWVAEGNRFLSGRDFLHSCKFRIGAIPTRSRTARGRRRDRMCRAGCLEPETLNHVLQLCHRTHVARIQRHDALVKYAAEHLRQKGFRVTVEPHLSTELGLRKPDIVATKDGASHVIDAQVVGEQADLDRAHRRKVEYYSTCGGLAEAIRNTQGSSEVSFHSLTLSCRGVWSPKSIGLLLQNNLLRKKDIKVLSSRVVIGGLHAWGIFNTTTSRMGARRAGIG